MKNVSAWENMVTCIAWGRRHYRTFDHKMFTFVGYGTYTVAQECAGGSEPGYGIFLNLTDNCPKDDYDVVFHCKASIKVC